MTDELFDVSQKTVLVSGGSRGIGLAVAGAFAVRGARVTITGRDEKTLKAACEAAGKTPRPIGHEICDVADTDAISACVARVAEAAGLIDVLINCTGVNIRKPATDYSPEEYDRIMGINLRGALFMAQEAGRRMIGQGGGSSSAWTACRR